MWMKKLIFIWNYLLILVKDTFAPKNRSEDSPLGLISIDSLFSPVKKVSFSIRILEQEVL